MSSTDAPPVVRNFSGTWRLDVTTSAGLYPLLRRLGYGWLARAVASNMAMDSEVVQSTEALLITDTSVLGKYTWSLVPDGKWRYVPDHTARASTRVLLHVTPRRATTCRPVMQVDRTLAPMRCYVKEG
ncbi:hypothetical protein EON67_06340, partial [archaeon]